MTPASWLDDKAYLESLPPVVLDAWHTCGKEESEEGKHAARHGLITANLAGRFARAAGISGRDEKLVIQGALLHDIGFAVTGRPSSNQRGSRARYQVREHPRSGGRYLEGLCPETAEFAFIAHLHQERIDGRGYPYGLSGVQIPYQVQIVSLADMVAALLLPSAYRQRMGMGYTEIQRILCGSADRRWLSSWVNVCLPVVAEALEQGHEMVPPRGE